MPRKFLIAIGLLAISGSLGMHPVSPASAMGLGGSKGSKDTPTEEDARSIEAFDQLILNLNEIYKTGFSLPKLTKIFGGGFEKAAPKATGSFLLVKKGGPVYEKIEILGDEKKPEQFNEVALTMNRSLFIPKASILPAYDKFSKPKTQPAPRPSTSSIFYHLDSRISLLLEFSEPKQALETAVVRRR